MAVEEALADESDFYGDENVQQDLEQQLRRRPKRRFEPPVSLSNLKKLKMASAGGEVPEVKSESPGRTNVLDFLKNRPQLASLQKSHVDQLKPAKENVARTAGGDFANDFIEVDRFRGVESAWQQDETIDNFLRRLPVDNPATPTSVDGWLWIGSPRVPLAQAKRTKPEDVMSFTAQSAPILEDFNAFVAKTESANPGKAAGSITKMITPYREQLECDLLACAVKTGVTLGKWMLFPNREDLPRAWRQVATATSEGRLGPTSKAAVYDPSKQDTLICVYTYDFTDNAEIRRVLDELIDLNVVSEQGRPIYYKCDAYTHLGLNSGNAYKLRASLYSSKDILNDEVKAFKNGPIERLGKKSEKITDFFRHGGEDFD